MITEGELKIWFVTGRHPTQPEIAKTDAEMEADGYEYDSHAWTFRELGSGCGVHHHYVRVYRKKQPTLLEAIKDYLPLAGVREWPADKDYYKALDVLENTIAREEEK